MPLPILGWIAVAAATATVAYLASDDDNSSSSSSSSDQGDREREAKQRAKEEKNEKILGEIRQYKDNQLSQIEKKYGATISFDSQTPSKIQILHQDKTRLSKINRLKNEKTEIEEAIKSLEAYKK